MLFLVSFVTSRDNQNWAERTKSFITGYPQPVTQRNEVSSDIVSFSPSSPSMELIMLALSIHPALAPSHISHISTHFLSFNTVLPSDMFIPALPLCHRHWLSHPPL
jgi:hypothetical protein